MSVLDEKGIPTIVERAAILPPHSSMSAVAESDIQQLNDSSLLKDKYSAGEDRQSAYELIQKQQANAVKDGEEAAKREEKEKSKKKNASSGRKKQTAIEKAVNSAASSIGREIGKKLIRGLLDTFLK